MISTTTGMPVTWRASAISSSPSSPNPWNVYGEVRGLKTPPRKACAPAARTARAVSSICSRLSTEQGPAMIAISSPPTLNPSSGKIEFLGWNCLEASLYGSEIRMTLSTPSSTSNTAVSTRWVSPIAPITVWSSPIERCGVNPFSRICSITCSTSTWVEPGFMMIIIMFFSFDWK